MSRDIFEKTLPEKIFVDEVTARAPEKNIAILLIKIIIISKNMLCSCQSDYIYFLVHITYALFGHINSLK